ncbi:MAG: radical protein [Geminicoccaceae bacterium]|nr:radical protein [Geminicoccaceae bacterium]
MDRRGIPAPPHKGRGATFNPKVRFESAQLDPFDDGWGSLVAARAEAPPPPTEVLPDASRTVIARNDSPDIPFEQSINPYRGCEHGCIYCYARPSHAYLGLSPGLDFETRILAKLDAGPLLERELGHPGYRCQPIALGTNTDPYQPQERRLGITRSILKVLAQCRHPVTIVTKSAAVTRDLDLLAPMAADGLARVALSVTTLEPALARTLEPRAAAPHRRLEAARTLSAAGVPTSVMVAPVIPALNDHEIEAVLEAAATAGVSQAGYVLLRLPHEVKELFTAWLEVHAPLRAERVLALVRQCRGGRLNDPTFGRRMRGEGAYAELIARRFALAKRRLGLDRKHPPLRTDLFEPPAAAHRQLRLL